MAKIKEFFKTFGQKLKKFNFYENRALLYIVPLAVILIAIICGTTYHLTNTSFDKFANVGVDFQGGTMLTVKFSETGMNSGSEYDTNLELIKEVLAQNGLTASVAQSSGDSAIVVRYLNTVIINGQIHDYSTDDRIKDMSDLNDKVKEDIATRVDSHYQGRVSAESTATLIGNSSALKLLRTALISAGIALLIILVYIFIRFDLYSALATIIALLHDIIIMMAFVVIFYVEISSTIIAAIVTIIAYSLNNTIIVFDRIRDNIKPYKTKGNKYDVGEIINTSIVGTLTRTLYTTITTLVVIVLLAILGVASIRTFALPITFGLIGGFYSSVFMVAPLWGILKNAGGKIKIARKNKLFQKKQDKTVTVK